jgi:hypothetical protein
MPRDTALDITHDAGVPAVTVVRSLDELLAGATSREPMKHDDSKSDATFERVVIDGESYVVKLFAERDWLADASRDDTVRAVGLFEDGVYARCADIVDPTVVGAARLGEPGGWPAALLMRDAAEEFVPYDAAVPVDTHAAFIEAMAALHARFWERPPATTYMDFGLNYDLLSPRQAVLERDRLGDRSDVLRASLAGWDAFAARFPDVWDVIRAALHDPRPIVHALLRTPRTFLHGDWKMGNLGRRPDGRVVLIDWDRPAVGPATFELAWYLAVNCDRLPESKEATITRYREALESHGVATAGWWDVQLSLTLLGGLLQFGWSKAGQPEEVAWWAEAADSGLRLL